MTMPVAVWMTVWMKVQGFPDAAFVRYAKAIHSRSLVNHLADVAVEPVRAAEAANGDEAKAASSPPPPSTPRDGEADGDIEV